MLSTKSVFGKAIRLTNERWAHIIDGHPEMHGFSDEVLLTIASPDFVASGSDEEMLAVSKMPTGKYLVVVFRETDDDGFVITAYFTSKIEKLTNRKILWRK